MRQEKLEAVERMAEEAVGRCAPRRTLRKTAALSGFSAFKERTRTEREAAEGGKVEEIGNDGDDWPIGVTRPYGDIVDDESENEGYATDAGSREMGVAEEWKRGG